MYQGADNIDWSAVKALRHEAEARRLPAISHDELANLCGLANVTWIVRGSFVEIARESEKTAFLQTREVIIMVDPCRSVPEFVKIFEGLGLL